MSRKGRKAEAHVRLYRHELESPAYRSLNTDARALLVELRALYRGGENRVFMSRREIEKRLGIGRWRAEQARDALLDRGFIRLLEQGSFQRKVRHAPVYALTNEPDTPDRDGAVPRNDYMRWPSSEKNSSGLLANRVGAGDRPRPHSPKLKNVRHGAAEQPRKARLDAGHGAGDQPTDKLPGSTSGNGVVDPMDAAVAVNDEELQFRLCWAATLLSIPKGALQ